MLFGTPCGCCDGRSAAKAPMSSGGGGSERELQEPIEKQSRDFAAHKKELDQLKR